MLHKIAYRLSLFINLIFATLIAFIAGAICRAWVEDTKKESEPEVDTTGWTRS